MAIGKKTGEFTFKLTSLAITDDGGGGQLHTSTWDGEASGYGTVLGTLSMRASGADAERGMASWSSTAYLESGELTQGRAEGAWNALGNHQWRVRAVNLSADGATFGSDGVIDLASRSFRGTLFEWD